MQIKLFYDPERVVIALKCLERYYNNRWSRLWDYWTPNMKGYNLLCKTRGVVSHDRVLNNDDKFKLERYRHEGY